MIGFGGAAGENMFKFALEAAGFEPSRSYFGKGLVVKTLAKVNPRRLQDCLYALRKEYRDPSIEAGNLSKVQTQDCLLGLDFVVEVTNQGKIYIFGFDVTTDFEAVDKKMADKRSMTDVYKEIGLDRVCITSLSVGDKGWLGLEEEQQDHLIDRVYTLIEQMVEAEIYVVEFRLH